jgi:hypothetical protein
MANKKFNKKATIKNICDRANLPGNGISIDTAGFNAKAKAKSGDKFVKEAAQFVGAEVVYQ